jgi:hypothetical protein
MKVIHCLIVFALMGCAQVPPIANAMDENKTSQSAAIRVVDVDYAIAVYIENTSTSGLEIVGNTNAGGSNSLGPLSLAIRNSDGSVSEISSVIEDRSERLVIRIPWGHLYGRTFSKNQLRQYFNVGPGRYSISARYEDKLSDAEGIAHGNLGSIESQWVDVSL